MYVLRRARLHSYGGGFDGWACVFSSFKEFFQLLSQHVTHGTHFFFLFLIARDNGLQNGKGISSENGLSFCLHGWMNGEAGANSRRFTPDLAW